MCSKVKELMGIRYNGSQLGQGSWGGRWVGTDWPLERPLWASISSSVTYLHSFAFLSVVKREEGK